MTDLAALRARWAPVTAPSQARADVRALLKRVKELENLLEDSEAEIDGIITDCKRADGALAHAGSVPTGNLERGIRLLTSERDELRDHVRTLEARERQLREDARDLSGVTIRLSPGALADKETSDLVARLINLLADKGRPDLSGTAAPETP